MWLTGGCNSWYIDERSGRATTLWPDYSHSFQEEIPPLDTAGLPGGVTLTLIEGPTVKDGRVAGKIALVTGGARGMGASHVEILARQGATVVFGDVDVDAGRDVEDRLRDNGLDVRFQRLDVASSQDWTDVVHVVREAGGLHVLINNAGVVDTRGAEDTGEGDWHASSTSIRRASTLALRTLVPVIRDSGVGVDRQRVVGVRVGRRGRLHRVHRVEGAVTLMTKSAAATYGPDGIRVNSIHPGAIQTPMLEHELAGLPAGARDGFLEATPLRRFADPAEVSACVLFLASDESSFVTGAELVVDGASHCPPGEVRRVAA